ncbi:MAG: hypothetical protein SGI83_06845 [Bacteroidota bacterium]|nr:hypothetical protein [Bacteroidota bacterium]
MKKYAEQSKMLLAIRMYHLCFDSDEMKLLLIKGGIEPEKGNLAFSI